MQNFNKKKQEAAIWFKKLRNDICSEFEKIEQEYLDSDKKHVIFAEKPGRFQKKQWKRDCEGDSDGGGGEMSIMKGNVFEKVGVNISTVFGQFSDEFRSQIPGTEENGEFFATGISLVAHMRSPLVPAVHMNTRYIVTGKEWFGGGGDLNPMYENEADTADFHQAFKNACDKYDPQCYQKFKKQCDEYFFIKHRGVARGVGGIFFDNLNSGDFSRDFDFTKDVGSAFLDIYPKLVRRNMLQEFNDEQRQHQLRKRGLYAEFNLVYDRGTKFGLMTGGNVEAILMSLPPVAKWD